MGQRQGHDGGGREAGAGLPFCRKTPHRVPRGLYQGGGAVRQGSGGQGISEGGPSVPKLRCGRGTGQGRAGSGGPVRRGSGRSGRADGGGRGGQRRDPRSRSRSDDGPFCREQRPTGQTGRSHLWQAACLRTGQRCSEPCHGEDQQRGKPLQEGVRQRRSGQGHQRRACQAEQQRGGPCGALHALRRRRGIYRGYFPAHLAAGHL